MKTESKALTIGGVLSLILFFTLVVPIVPYATRVSYYDFINGQYRGYSSTLGFKYKEADGLTSYGELVEKLKLQDDPVWYKTSARIYCQDIPGGYSMVRAVATDLSSFTTWAELDAVDNLTSEIRGIQTVARKGDVRELEKYLSKVHRRIVSNLPEDLL